MAYNPTSNDFANWQLDSSNDPTANNSPSNTSYLHSLFQTYSPQNNPDLNAILGAGDALRNTLASGANLIPGVNIPMAKTGQGTAYNVGNVAGNLGAFAGGGELLDAARLGAEGIPYIGKALSSLSDNPEAQNLLQKYLPGIARRALGVGAYGVATNPNERLMGGAEGVGGSLIGEALPYGLGKIGQAAQYFMPTTYMQKIIQGLGGGKTLEDATKAVIGGVKDAYDNREAIASNRYNPILNSVGDKKIYNEITPQDSSIYGSPITNYKVISKSYSPIQRKIDNSNDSIWGSNAFNENKQDSLNDNDPYIFGSPSDKNISSYTSSNMPTENKYNGSYPNLSENIFDSLKGGLNDLHNKFLDNPTFQNAHDLQSQLGTNIRKLEGGKISPDAATQDRIYDYKTARAALKNDMNSFLEQESPHLAEMNSNASDDFYKNVAPYRADPNIYGMANGDIENITPQSLGSVFSAPGSNLNKVVGDLPQDAINNMLYTRLGQRVVSKNPESFINSVTDLDKQGLGSYISPDLENQISSLKNRMMAKNALQGTLGAVLGAKSTLGHGGVPAAVGLGALGASVAKPLFNKISDYFPIQQLAQSIGNVTRGTYPIARNAILANTLQGVNQ